MATTKNQRPLPTRIPKPRSDAKLKNLARVDQDTLWVLMHPTDSTVPAYSLEDARVYMLEAHGLSVVASSLSQWQSWYALNLRMEAREDAAEQLKAEMARNPHNSEEAIRQAGQRLFMTEGIIERNFRQFSGAAKMTDEITKLQQAEKKISLLKKAGDRDERKLRLLEDKAAEAKAVLLTLTSNAKSRGGLTPETLAEIERAAGLL